ncbi:MAG: hypothetical protein FJ308_01550 [Planctomycetes bacterium]|nr:hypothetical protein [Planctomycetota bacterium]
MKFPILPSQASGGTQATSSTLGASGVPGGLPVSAPNGTADPNSLAGIGAPTGGGAGGGDGAGANPWGIPIGSTDPSTETLGALGKLPFTDIHTQKYGLGAWLLLGPMILVGLALWTFSPRPSTSRRK